MLVALLAYLALSAGGGLVGAGLGWLVSLPGLGFMIGAIAAAVFGYDLALRCAR